MTATLRTDLNEFLFAPVGEDAAGNPLTLLTVLARLDIDPWDEAADLARLSRESAVKKLVVRLEALPNALLPPADNTALATRLIALLHRSPAPKERLPGTPPQATVVVRSKGINPAIYYLVAVIFMFIAQWALTRQPQAPADTTQFTDSRK